ncbi:1-deoxy-D-xylulose-5-phosphate reductoisomerase [Pelagibacterales bacterium SAG-MED22]|nr:1-deoxy-D-xylulose-5-phosphate reductoisomerase [Pelagibacterales bacterium SAG-MED22]
MKKKIAIVGSTGSIGKNLLEIISNDINDFKIILLTADKDYKTLLKQAKKFNVTNLIIKSTSSYKILKKKTSNTNINVYNSFEHLGLIFKNKIDYVMNSIMGIDGLEPTIKIIKYTKNIAIANKESIICGWNIILKELKKNNTNFIPVDSEHFSIWYGMQNLKVTNVEKIYLTASGGPFRKLSLNKFKNIKINQAVNHPNWIMGKKISVDSATMINKVYEVIEAKNIFNIPYQNIEIIIHPKSYIHALIKFTNGLTTIIAHDTTMKIPIFNSLYLKSEKKISTNTINLKTLNNLNLSKLNSTRYPMIKLLKILPSKSSLFETVIVAANDTLVNLFLNKKINFINIQKELFKILKLKEFNNFKKISPKKLEDVIKLNDYVRLKVLKKVYKFTDV